MIDCQFCDGDHEFGQRHSYDVLKPFVLERVHWEVKPYAEKYMDFIWAYGPDQSRQDMDDPVLVSGFLRDIKYHANMNTQWKWRVESYGKFAETISQKPRGFDP